MYEVLWESYQPHGLIRETTPPRTSPSSFFCLSGFGGGDSCFSFPGEEGSLLDEGLFLDTYTFGDSFLAWSKTSASCFILATPAPGSKSFR